MKLLKEEELDDVSKARIKNQECIDCGAPLFFISTRKKSFCNSQCHKHYFYYNNKEYQIKVREVSAAYHNAHKDEPAYKEKQKIRWKKWCADNKEHYNDMMRKYMKKRSYDLYHQRKKDGRCVYCGKVEPEIGRVGCRPCADKDKKKKQ